MSVQNNTTLSRYELDVDGVTAFADYRLVNDTVIITHVETPHALRGRGIASKVTKGALDLIRKEGLKVVPQCSFAVAYLEGHPEYHDLLA